MVQPGMASYSPGMQRLSHGDGGSEPGHIEADVLSDEDDAEPLFKRQTFHDSLDRARRSASTIPHSAHSHHSNLLELQIEEMLREVRPNYSTIMGPLDTALRKLRTLIESIEDHEPLSVAEASKLMHKSHKIVVPFPDPKPNKDAAYRLAYSRPSDINIVGSYALQTLTKEDHRLVIDMVVTLPECILQEKDYLNYRYFYKRSFYISCIAAGLQEKAGDEFEICFEYLGDNNLQPVLILKPSKSFARNPSFDLNYQICIIPAAPGGFFPETKLQPMKNAIRSNFSPGDADNSSHPTPFYNATLRADSNFLGYLRLLRLTSRKAHGFKDACILGRIWLRQRGFKGTISEGGFGHFEWAVLTALLLQGAGPGGQAVLSPDYSSYQLFKAVIQYLASNNLSTNPVIFQAAGLPLPKADSPTFYDSTRGHNVLFKMTVWSYAMLHKEANISIEMLNNISCDQFEATFIIRKDNFLQQYDSLLTLPIPKVMQGQQNEDHMNLTARFASNVYAILKEGLTDRVKDIRLMVPSRASWPLRASGPFTHSDIQVGFIFDPISVDRIVDHGPAAENGQDAARFRKFWGEKAELRRFKDGSILESLVWSHDSDVPVFGDIVTYLLRRHLGAEIGGKIKFVDYDISGLLDDSKIFTKAYSNLRAAFAILEQDLRSVEGLPLQLKFMSATNPQLRFCSVQPPIFNPGHYLRDPADVLVQFEGSGRWPDNLLAIQRTKIAFLLKIGNLLEASVDGVVTRLGLENTNRALCNCAFLDVMYASGAAFRLRIYIEREQFLLEHMLKDQISGVQTREEVIAARSLLTLRYVQLPLHTQSMATQCTRYPVLSSTIRLVKKWFSSHMLSSHIREEVMELIVMHIFLQPCPWRAPSSVLTGFWRVLHFISRWDWRVTPLIVDFSRSMPSKDVAAIHTRLTAWRKIDPAMNRMVLFVASNHDTTGTVFTDGGPSKVVAARMTALARSAWRVANMETTKLDMRNVFKCSTKDYNFIIHISAQFTCDRRSGHENQRRFKNLRLQENGDISHLGYDPVQLFLAELEMLYTTSIVFFHNPLERSIIAGVWNPQTTSRPFKINIPYGIKPLTGSSIQQDDQQVEIDQGAILSDIARLGGDLVAQIEIHP